VRRRTRRLRAPRAPEGMDDSTGLRSATKLNTPLSRCELRLSGPGSSGYRSSRNTATIYKRGPDLAGALFLFGQCFLLEEASPQRSRNGILAFAGLKTGRYISLVERLWVLRGWWSGDEPRGAFCWRCGDGAWNDDGWSAELLLPESMELSSGTQILPGRGLRKNASRAFSKRGFPLRKRLKHTGKKYAREKCAKLWMTE
jgi:hypothetical protein